MQVAAMAPVAVDKDDVPAEVVDQELKIAKEKFRQEGKPENMLDKIAQGALNKFFKESTLLNQIYVKDGKITIREFLASNDKELNVTDFQAFHAECLITVKNILKSCFERGSFFYVYNFHTPDFRRM